MSLIRSSSRRIVLAAAALLAVTSADAGLLQEAQFSLGGNYQYFSQNPAGDDPSHNLTFTLTPSAILKDVHETGLSLSLNRNSQEITAANRTDVTLTMTTGVFYRYNYYVTPKGSPRAWAVYAGPQMGFTRIQPGSAAPSSTDFSIGGQLGANVMLSEKFALNIHLIQWDTVFADRTQLILTQSLGVKYFF